MNVELELLLFCSSSAHKAASVSTTNKKVLILGAGYVSAPVVEYLTRKGDISVTVG